MDFLFLLSESRIFADDADDADFKETCCQVNASCTLDIQDISGLPMQPLLQDIRGYKPLLQAVAICP